MKLHTKEFIQKLLSEEGGTCLSLYMPTHRTHPENLQDPIRFKSLIKKLEESLMRECERDEAEKLLKPFKKIGKDSDFWNHTLNGIAIFSTPKFTETVNLPVPVEELVVVADSLHTKPLLKYLQSVDRYQILGLTRHDIKLFEGNRHSLSEINIPSEVPKTIEEALGEELTDGHTTVAAYGGTTGESSAMRHGHGGRKDQLEIDEERFFRVIADGVSENLSKPTGLPLILAALPEHHNLFHKVNKNGLLLPNSIALDPKSAPTDKLKNEAWKIMEPEYLKRLASLSDDFMTAKSKGEGTEDPKEAVVAAVEGRIDTLLVESDRIIPGKISDFLEGKTQKRELADPKVDDLLDDLGEMVTKMGGQVVVIPSEKMPVKSGLAAIYRY
nr:hypothetical protein [Saprospiraceae bacterium]